MNKQRIEAVEAEINFRAHAIDRKIAAPEVKAKLKELPKDRQSCRVRGAMAGMWEPAVVCGYMMTSHGLKALIIYEDRESADDGPGFDFVLASRIMAPHSPKPKVDLVDRMYRRKK